MASSSSSQQNNPNESTEQIRRMFQMLREKSETTVYPINSTKFLEEFRTKTNTSDTLNKLRKCFLEIKSKISYLNGISTTTKVKMMFWAQAKLDNPTMESLRTFASVELDEQNRIVKLCSIERILEMDRSFWYSTDDSMKMWERIDKRLINSEIEEVSENIQSLRFEIEMVDFIRFLARSSRDTVTPVGTWELFKGYRTKNGKKITVLEATNRVNKFYEHIDELTSLGTKTKVQILFAWSISITDDLLKELQKRATVEVDEHRRIIKYYGRSLNLNGAHKATDKIEIEDDQREFEEELEITFYNKLRRSLTTGEHFDRNELTDAMSSDEEDSDDDVEYCGSKRRSSDFIQTRRIDHIKIEPPEDTDSIMDVKPIVKKPDSCLSSSVDFSPEAAPASSSEINNTSTSSEISMENEQSTQPISSVTPRIRTGRIRTGNYPVAVKTEKSIKIDPDIQNSMKRKSTENGLSSTEKKSRRVEQSPGYTGPVHPADSSIAEEPTDPEGATCEDQFEIGASEDPNTPSAPSASDSLIAQIATSLEQQESTYDSPLRTPRGSDNLDSSSYHEYLNIGEEATTTQSSSTRNLDMILPKEHKKLLESIQGLIQKSEIPKRERLLMRIERKINELEAPAPLGDRVSDGTQIWDITNALSLCVKAVTRAAKLPPMDNSIGLREFRRSLWSVVVSVDLPALNESLEYIEKEMGIGSEMDMRVPLDRVRSGLETVLNIVAP